MNFSANGEEYRLRDRFDMIREYMLELDPLGLTGFPVMAPLDEYDEEIERLIDWMDGHEKASVEDVVNAMQGTVFTDDIRIEKRKEDYELFAKQVLGLTTAHKCPVCHKSIFPSRGSYDICEVCWWEDDLLILENGKLMTRANQLSLFESQLEYWMLTDERTKERALKLYQKSKELSDDDYVRGLLRLYWELGTTSNIEEAIEDTLDELHAWDAFYEESE